MSAEETPGKGGSLPGENKGQPSSGLSLRNRVCAFSWPEGTWGHCPGNPLRTCCSCSGLSARGSCALCVTGLRLCDRPAFLGPFSAWLLAQGSQGPGGD